MLFRSRLWDAATGRLHATLDGHEHPIVRVAFSPDGTRLASASHDHTARLLNAADGEILVVLAGHRDRLHDLAFAPDGRRLATASRDGTMREWGLSNAEMSARRRAEGATPPPSR